MFHLFVYVAIAWAPYGTGAGYTFKPKQEWVNQGLFVSEASCKAAAANLAYPTQIVRCVKQ